MKRFAQLSLYDAAPLCDATKVDEYFHLFKRFMRVRII